ncbi:lysophospholipase [Erysipelothrix sp. P66]|uniref:alpha/beta hydrolase n=1 Tax=Erysipelothrix sp. P66 TaxID=3141531 RepID=UPI00315CB32A
MYDYLKVSQDASLFYIKNSVPKPRGVVVMCHGFTNHSGDYDVYARLLNEHQYSVYRYDMRGHGKTKSERGDIDSFETYVKDLHTIIRLATRENIHIPLFTLGFSMGGLISALYGVQYPNSLSGQVFLGPAVGYVSAVRGPNKLALKVMNKIADDLLVKFSGDSLELNNPVQKEALERDYAFTSKNPLKLSYFTVRFAKTVFIDGAETILSQLKYYRYPVLIAQGENDPTVPKDISETFYDKIRSKDKQLKIYPNMNHVLYDEPNGMVVMQESVDWLNDRTTPRV